MTDRKKRGGARQGAGLAKDSTGVMPTRQVKIDDARVEKARRAGNGNMSLGIRRAIDLLPNTADISAIPHNALEDAKALPLTGLARHNASLSGLPIGKD